MRHCFVLVVLTIFCLSPVWSQNNLGYRAFDSIPVLQNGVQLPMPWVGGFNNPQFSDIDLDGDGVMDLFVFDRDGHTIKTFINNGTANAVDYVHAPQYQSQFPNDLEGFVLLRDYNCDGKKDFFTYAPGGFEIYRNDFDTSLKWTLMTDLLLADFFGINESNAFIIPNDVPSIEDLDNDGDLDIISFGIGSSKNTMVYYRNLSMENYGTCDSLDFEFSTTCWGNVAEPPVSQILIYQLCKGGGSQGGSLRGHPGSTLLTIDMDGDDDKDLIIGDILKQRLLYIENVGDEFTAALDTATQDTIWPNNTTPVAMDLMPASYYVDVDNDAVNDLLVTPNNTIDSSLNVQNVWWYKNTGTNNVPVFDYQTNSLLADDMIDVGLGAHPLFFDVNGDGDYDLLVANDLRHSVDNGRVKASVSYYENVGQFSFAPEFELVTTDFSNLSMLELTALHLTSGDLDDDGDEDLIIGDEQGFLHYFQNDPVNDSAVFTLQQPANYMNIDVSSHATPQLVDANGDNLLDLLVGERTGFIKYYENTGTAQVAQFDSLPTQDTLGGIIVKGGFNGYTSPFLTDELDTLGTTFLCVGTTEGKILVYDDVENNLGGTFTKVDSIVTNGARVNPTGKDLVGDGKLDLLVGQLAGGLTFYTRALIIPIGVPENMPLVDAINLFPNPVQHQLTLDISANYAGQSRLVVVDLMGKQVMDRSLNLQSGLNRVPLDVSKLAQGVYFLQVQGSDQAIARKFIVTSR